MNRERHLHLFFRDPDKAILKQFTPEQQAIIQERQQLLTVLASYIGKDFAMPVRLNQPGAGWYWDAKRNEIRIDPKDILEKPMDYLRFVTSHEGGHRRISRIDMIPENEWSQPGFSFMMNAIEDPRDNNFVASTYPPFQEQMKLAYEMDIDFESKLKDKAQEQLGQLPRFMLAGLEYIKQWFRATQGQEFAIDPTLPDDVRKVVALTLLDAEMSWQYYPSKEEADGQKGEQMIRAYAHQSYVINRDKVWPLFKTLVEADVQDQRTQQFMNDMKKRQEQGDTDPLPEELKKDLTPEELQELQDALNGMTENNPNNPQNKKEQQNASKQKSEEDGKNSQGDSPMNELQNQQPQNKDNQSEQSSNPNTSMSDAGNSQENTSSQESSDDNAQAANQNTPEEQNSVSKPWLSPELAEKLKQFIDALPKLQRDKLIEQARKMIESFEQEANEELAGKLSSDEHEKKKKNEGTKENTETLIIKSSDGPSKISLDKFRKVMEAKLHGDKTSYEKVLDTVLPLVDQLEQDLRDIFTVRSANKKQTGYRSGSGIDIGRRIQEKAREIPPVESKSWERREKPDKKDYAITLLIDLSGSMKDDGKIDEAFRATVLLAEVLNRLSIKTEIIGFTDQLYLYQQFGESMNDTVRENMASMREVVYTPPAMYNDDGWALASVSERLAQQKEREQFIFVLSDGTPVPSFEHIGNEYELSTVIDKITTDTNQRVIGLGVGYWTDHVAYYYPEHLANISVEELAQTLGDKLREVIANG